MCLALVNCETYRNKVDKEECVNSDYGYYKGQCISCINRNRFEDSGAIEVRVVIENSQLCVRVAITNIV